MESCRVAIDLGAGSGRIFCGDSTHFEEVHRFPNTWVFSRTLASIREGLSKLAGRRIASISCDSWAQDFGLLDKEGNLFYEPVSYLSGRADAMPEKIANSIPEDEFFRLSGLRGLGKIATLSQWSYMAEAEPEALAKAGRLLPVADLVLFKLCGTPSLNFSLASAAHLLEPGSCRCNVPFLKRLGLNPDLAGNECVQPGIVGRTVAGDAVPPEMAGIPVISGIGHDTAAAFYGCGLQPGEAGLSLGSWGMIGTLDANGGLGEQTSLFGVLPGQYVHLASCQGMRLLQQCVRQWKEQGAWPGYAEYDAAVKETDFAGEFRALYVTYPPPNGDMLGEIARHCTLRPATMAEYGRALCRSVAAGIADGLQALERSTNSHFKCLKVSGGGIADANLIGELRQRLEYPLELVCQEAAVRGNLLIQEKILPTK